MKLQLILSVFILFSPLIENQSIAQGTNCISMDPLCLDSTTYFLVTTGTEAEDGNDYGCLFTQPNPNWYYLKIATAGDIEMELFAGSDIDFIVYGPFADLDDAIANCGVMGSITAPIVDCSYSGVAYETPEINDALVGEYYVLLVTNYAAVEQIATISKIGGEASLDCTDIIGGACFSYSGTFKSYKNNALTASEISLCLNDSIQIYSDDNYILPPDIIPTPEGDGIYTAQVIWLVYDAPPTTTNPLVDPGYLDLIIPTENFLDAHNNESPIIDAVGCGTYYMVPFTADDGAGDGGEFDNYAIHWDLDSNLCYDIGAATIVTYQCAELVELPSDTLCVNDDPLALEADPSGGVFSGFAVESGSFSPLIAGPGLHTVYYEYETDAGCTFIDSTLITVVSCLGIAEFDFSSVNIYPNPFNGFTRINFGEDLQGEFDLSITNILNQEVMKIMNLTGNSLLIYRENLEAGIYFVKLISNDKTYLSIKVIIVD